MTGGGADAWAVFDCDDPYPLYEELRAGPHRAAGARSAYFVADRAGIVIGRDDAVLSAEMARWRNFDPRQRRMASVRWREHTMLGRDGLAHARLRRPFAKALSEHRAEALRPRVVELAGSLLRQCRRRGDADLVSEFAYPLAGAMICELIGIPPHLHADCIAQSRDLAPLLGMDAGLRAVIRADAAVGRLRETMNGLVAARRAEPRDDVISKVLELQAADATLDDSEVVDNLILLLGAGHETTANFIAIAALALLRSPAPALRGVDWSHAVEELLRFDSSVQATCRVVAEPVELANATVPAGELVVLLLGAANRDVDRPGLDLDRKHVQHFSFGLGAHHCPGAGLARVEAQVALEALGTCPERIRVRDEAALQWRRGSFFRGLRALPVAFEPR